MEAITGKLVSSVNIEKVDINLSANAESRESVVDSRKDARSDGSPIILSYTAQLYRALGKVINFMRKRYFSGIGVQPLTANEILAGTNQTNLNAKICDWLFNDALRNHRRIKVCGNGLYYQFRPAYKLQNTNDLITLLQEHERKGLGAVLTNDVRDSLPNCQDILNNCDPRFVVHERPLDRKNVIYYVEKGHPGA